MKSGTSCCLYTTTEPKGLPFYKLLKFILFTLFVLRTWYWYLVLVFVICMLQDLRLLKEVNIEYHRIRQIRLEAIVPADLHRRYKFANILSISQRVHPMTAQRIRSVENAATLHCKCCLYMFIKYKTIRLAQIRSFMITQLFGILSDQILKPMSHPCARS